MNNRNATFVAQSVPVNNVFSLKEAEGVLRKTDSVLHAQYCTAANYDNISVLRSNRRKRKKERKRGKKKKSRKT